MKGSNETFFETAQYRWRWFRNNANIKQANCDFVLTLEYRLSLVCVENRFCNLMHECRPVFFTLIPKIMLILVNDHRLIKHKHIFKYNTSLARCRYMKHIIGYSTNYFTEPLQNISNLLMIQDHNAQNKLLMDEWSFQGLPLVLNRLHINLQIPTVVGQKLTTPSTLI